MTKEQFHLLRNRNIIENVWSVMKLNYNLIYHRARSITGLFRHFFYSIPAFLFRHIDDVQQWFLPNLAFFTKLEIWPYSLFTAEKHTCACNQCECAEEPTSFLFHFKLLFWWAYARFSYWFDFISRLCTGILQWDMPIFRLLWRLFDGEMRQRQDSRANGFFG